MVTVDAGNTVAAPASEVEAIIRSPTNMAAADGGVISRYASYCLALLLYLCYNLCVTWRPVGEWGDDESWCVAEVLVRVAELSVTDVGETVELLLVPTMTQLRQPRERLRVLHLLSNQLGHHVTVVHLRRTIEY